MANIFTKYIPNTVTCLNLFSGCIACVMAFEARYELAFIFIILSAVFDFFDGMLARLFYSYDNKYMFTGSVRRDGYSAFGTSNPHAVFSSVALAWTFTNEKFFRWKPLSFGKLRVSWGQNGNRQLGDPYLALADLGTGIGSTYGYVNSSTGEYTQLRYMSISRIMECWSRSQLFGRTHLYLVGLLLHAYHRYDHEPNITLVLWLRKYHLQFGRSSQSRF